MRSLPNPNAIPRIAGTLLLAAGLASCGSNATSLDCSDGACTPNGTCTSDATILFIGNSLTYTNDLPGMLEGLSRAAGDEEPLRTQSVVAPNVSLEDHWNQGSARAFIECGGWSVVVLQQGPSSLPASRDHLVFWSERFDESIRGVEAEPALYMVWPSDARSFAFDDVSGSYRAAAEAVGGLLFPVGDAWQAAWELDPGLQLYGPDGFHPSVAGTYTAALVAYAVLTGESPVGLPRAFSIPGGGSVSIPEADASVLQEAAAEVVGGS